VKDFLVQRADALQYGLQSLGPVYSQLLREQFLRPGTILDPGKTVVRPALAQTFSIHLPR
jgi:hypothetical protein